MSEPKVSVVMPVFNRAATVARAVSSVLGQTFDDLELIVVDDGSTDGTASVLDGFADRRLRPIGHVRNRGAAAARNTGIATARGDYVALIDSDDCWTHDKLDVQLRFMLEAPAERLVSCTGFWLHKAGRWHLRVPARARYDVRRIAAGCRLSPGTTFLADRRHVDRVGGFDEDLARFEDWDWLIRSARATPIWTVHRPLAEVHVTTRPLGDEIRRSVSGLRAKHLADMEAIDGATGRSFRAALAVELAAVGVCERNRLATARHVMAALSLSPAIGAVHVWRIAGALRHAIGRSPYPGSPARPPR